jgi:hypothetical protein
MYCKPSCNACMVLMGSINEPCLFYICGSEYFNVCYGWQFLGARNCAWSVLCITVKCRYPDKSGYRTVHFDITELAIHIW